MASSGSFTSVQAICDYFGTKMAPLEIQIHFMLRCSDCLHSFNLCLDCGRKYDIISQDLATLKQLEAREIDAFNHPEKYYDSPVFQQLYARELAQIKREMEGFTEIDTLAKYLEDNEIGGLAKMDTQEKHVDEKGIGAEGKGAVVLDMGTDVIEKKFDALEEGVNAIEKEVGVLEKEVDDLDDGVGAVTMEWGKLVERLDDLDRWFDMEDDVMKAKGWI